MAAMMSVWKVGGTVSENVKERGDRKQKIGVRFA
jgi:hypothetical protein